MAKEYPDPLNNYPSEVVTDEDGQKHTVRRTCDCGGRLQYDHNMVLYCTKCFLEAV